MDIILNTARKELAMFLDKIYNKPYTIDRNGSGYSFFLRIDCNSDYDAVIKANKHQCTITGRNESELLSGVYAYLEKLGYVFTVNGPQPARRILTGLPEFEMRHNVKVIKRGIRQHINFPMDISSYHLCDAKEYVRNLARMKYNTIVFHMYEPCGWYENDNPDLGIATPFYSELHTVPEDEFIADRINNRKIYCIPEMESGFGTKNGLEYAIYWLGKVMQECKRYGIYVIASIEPCMPNMSAYKGTPEDHYGRSLDATLKTAKQVLSLYPQIDELELISGENVVTPSNDADADITKLLGKIDQHVKIDIDSIMDKFINNGVGVPADKQDDYKGKLLNCLESIYISLTTIDKLKSGFPDKKYCISTYSTSPHTMKAISTLLLIFMPDEYNISFMNAHSACRVNKNLDLMELSNLKKLRLISWIEFDADMYTYQFPIREIYGNIRRLASDNGTVSSIVFNHWRNSENELGLLMAADICYYGNTVEDTFERLGEKLFGSGATTLLDKLCELDSHSIETDCTAGFCHLPCWVTGEKMSWCQLFCPHEASDKGVRICDGIISVLDGMISGTEDFYGLNRMRFLKSIITATRVHIQCVDIMVRMRELLASKDEFTDSDKKAFDDLGFKALKYAYEWLDIMTGNITDRGMEGSVVSYHHVIVCYIRKNMDSYGTVKSDIKYEYKLGKEYQAPPAVG